MEYEKGKEELFCRSLNADMGKETGLLYEGILRLSEILRDSVADEVTLFKSYKRIQKEYIETILLEDIDVVEIEERVLEYSQTTRVFKEYKAICEYNRGLQRAREVLIKLYSENIGAINKK